MSNFKLLIFTPFLLLSFKAGVAQSELNKQKLDSLHTLVKRTKKTTEKIDVLLALCTYYRKINTENLDSLSYYASRIITLTATQKKLENRKVDALDHLAFVAYYRRENDLAQKYIREYKEISQKTGYGIGLSNASYLSAYITLDDGDINKYIYQLENAYQIAKDYKVPEPVIFKMGIGLSSGYSEYNFNSDLIAKVLLEMQDLVESPDISLQDKGIFYLDLGTLYKGTNENEIKDYIKSERNFKKAQEHYTETKDYKNVGDCLDFLGKIYLKKNAEQQANTLFDRAVENYKKSIATNKKNNVNITDITSAYFQIVVIVSYRNQ